MTLQTIQTTQLDIPPGMIHLGIGQPDPSLLPLALMKNAAEHRLGHDDGSLLAYGAESGDGYFRLALSQFLTEHYHKPVDPDDLFVTAGASQGLDLICTLFTKPGDTIFVEEPSYFLALDIFRDHGLNIIGLPMDENGLMVEALDRRSDTTPSGIPLLHPDVSQPVQYHPFRCPPGTAGSAEPSA